MRRPITGDVTQLRGLQDPSIQVIMDFMSKACHLRLLHVSMIGSVLCNLGESLACISNLILCAKA